MPWIRCLRAFLLGHQAWKPEVLVMLRREAVTGCWPVSRGTGLTGWEGLRGNCRCRRLCPRERFVDQRIQPPPQPWGMSVAWPAAHSRFLSSPVLCVAFVSPPGVPARSPIGTC